RTSPPDRASESGRDEREAVRRGDVCAAAGPGQASTTMAVTAAPLLRDVTLRAGLQLTGKPSPVEHKVDIVRRLLALGVPALEIGSLARPDLVPPMANSMELVAALTPEELERCWLWVATPRHVEKAAAAGVRNFQYCFSVS